MTDILKQVPKRAVEAAVDALVDNTDFTIEEAEPIVKAVLIAAFEVLWGGK